MEHSPRTVCSTDRGDQLVVGVLYHNTQVSVVYNNYCILYVLQKCLHALMHGGIIIIITGARPLQTNFLPTALTLLQLGSALSMIVIPSRALYLIHEPYVCSTSLC